MARTWTRRAQRRRSRSVLSVLLALVAVAAAFMFLRSPYFAVVEVEVAGLSTLAAEEMVAWSGIQAETLIWQMSPEAVARRIETHPVVAGAAVTRRWPNRVVINILERTPVATGRYQQLWMLIDGDGIVYRMQPQRQADLPELRGQALDDLGALELGQSLPPALVAGARTAAYVKQYDLDWVRAVEIVPDGIMLWLEDEVPVMFGDPTASPDLKLAVLNTLWNSWRGDTDRVRYFDVRSPERPVVRTDTE